MEPIDNELLLRDAERYGYQLFQASKENPEETLVRMLQTDDLRLLEGVPVVLANMLARTPNMSLTSVEERLPGGLQKRFRLFAAVTTLFSFWVPSSEVGRETLTKFLKSREPGLVESVQEKLRKSGKLNVGNNVVLDAERLEKTFKNYVVHEFMDTRATLQKKLENERDMLFREALLVLFTEKQKELLFKMLNKSPLTKSEREYYSRAVKPRLKALRNPDLQSLAVTLLG